MKIYSSTKVILYKDNKIIMKDVLANVIGYLYNRHLIDLPDEYWGEDEYEIKEITTKDIAPMMTFDKFR